MQIEFFPSPEYGIKTAASREEVQQLMDRVYNEDPSYWPYGLKLNSSDTDVFVIRDKMTKQACGFVGWQETKENDKKVGSYYIGILPEFRGNGLAKEAVSKVIQKKAATVDVVKAYIMAHNKPSTKLAESLHIPIQNSF